MKYFEKLINWTVGNPRSWGGKLFILFSLLITCQEAQAAPVIAVVAAVGAFLGFTGAAGIIVGAIAIGAAAYAATAFLGYLGMKMPNMDMNASKQAEGVQIQRRGSVEQIPIVYGHRRIAGIVTFATTGSTDNKYMWIVYTFCEGPIEGIRKIYIDDWDLDTDKSEGYMAGVLNAGDKKVTVDWGKYKGRVQMFFSKGQYYSDPTTSTINDYIMGTGNVFEGVPEKTSTATTGYSRTMVHNGLTTLWVRYEWIAGETNPFSGSIPLIHLDMLGRRVQSLWNQSNIASASNPYNTQVTSTQSAAYGTNERYSTNPVECLLDYLRNPRYGKGMSVNEIDWDSWYAASKKCYTMVPCSIAGETQPILKINAVVMSDATLFNNVKTLLQNFRAYMPYIQGKYKLYIEDAGNATDILSGTATISRTFTQDNIMGDITYSGVDRSVKYNQVAVTYVEPTNKFSNDTVVYPTTEAERQTYIVQDGGREYKYEITFPAITSRDMALDMAKLIFNKSRYQETIAITVTSEAYNLQIGDSVYIQSLILDFADVPWRIVSKQITKEHKIALQLVRNPDFIYPYVRAGEKDIVLPTYVPKGVDRIIPKSIELFPIGIIPPTKASLPSGVTVAPNPVINPAPSNVAVSNNFSTVTTVISTPPKDTITITGFTTKYTGSQAFLNFTWTHADIAMWAGVEFYLEQQIGNPAYSLYATYTTKTTVGSVITFPILVPPGAMNWTVVTTVLYTTGDRSTISSTITAHQYADTATTATTTTTSTTTSTTPTATTATTTTTPVYTTTTSTTTPTTTTPVIVAPVVRDNYCSTLLGNVTTAGYTSDPRVITWTLTLNAINNDIIGFNYYIKPSVETTWRTFQGRNQSGLAFNSANPTVETLTLSNVGTATAFDLIIRVAYKDGTESTRQQRFSFNITSPSSTYPYNFFYGINPTGILENTSAYNPTLSAPGTVGSGRAIRMNIASTRYSGANGIMITMDPPAAADKIYWYGQTIRYRPYTPGSNPAFTTLVDKTSWTTTAGPGGAVYVTPTITPIVYDQKYEIVVTPYVDLGSGTKGDADYSWYGVGFLNNTTASILYPADNNWNFNFNWQNVLTSSALQTINTTFTPPVMADATVQLSQFDTYNVNGNYTSDALDNGTSFVLQAYHKLAYSGVGITNYKGVRIYRRSINGASVNEITGSYSAYYGWGRWEYVDTTATSATLRGPTVYNEFNPYYQVPGGGGNSNLLAFGYQSAYNGNLGNNNKKQIQPANMGNQQFLIVVQFTDNSFSTKGLLINIAKSKASAPNPYNQLKPNLPQVVSLSSYDSYTAGYYRNLNEARGVLASTGVGLSASQPYAPSGTEASITKFVTYPTTDSTVGGSITPGIQ